MVDLSTLKAGDEVRIKLDENTASYLISFNNTPGFKFDIIEIIPKAFDWADVKPGMGFVAIGGQKGTFIGYDKASHVVLEIINYNKYPYDGFSKKKLIRSPEYDIKQ